MSDPRDLTDGELDPIQILALSEIIREVDGNHSLGAAALAEAILSHPGSRWGRPAPAPAEASAAPTWPANFTRSKRAAQARRLCIAANLPESSPIVNRITREAANGLSLKDVVDLIASESSEPGVSAHVSATQRHPAPVLVAPYREIADLVVWLEDHSAECLELDRSEWAKSIAKAARFLHLYLKAAQVPVPVSERLKQIEDLAADAVGALRYIEQVHGRFHGVGWDRVYEKAESLSPAADLLEQCQASPVPVGVSGQPDGRDPECVKRWPDCFDGGYHPRCCRFPKSCSCGVRFTSPLPNGEVN